jgi:GNAT superfamily N-acetyltransferase
MIIRNPSSEDEGAWKCLWAGYNEFYETNVPAAVTQRTWERILDPASPMFARLAEDEGHVVGFAVCVLHEGTWTLDSICYLEDLFVEPNFRGRKAGRESIGIRAPIIPPGGFMTNSSRPTTSCAIASSWVVDDRGGFAAVPVSTA